MGENNIGELIFQKVADLSGRERSEINATTTLESLGLDSADAVVLAMEVEQMVGREVEVGLFLRAPTIGDAIAEVVEGGGGAAKPPTS
jgi:acyl carrier protein